jgi:hypothetical protein
VISNELDKEAMEQQNLAQADAHLDRLFKTDLEEPWYKTIVGSIREALNRHCRDQHD